MDHEEWYAYVYPKNLGHQETPKLLCPRLVERLAFTYDQRGEFYLDNVDVNGVMVEGETSPWYVLAVLNSRLIDYLFKKGSVPFRGNWYSANRQFIEVLPIHAIDDQEAADIAAHDALAELARRMLDLNATHQAVTDAFAEAVRGYERTPISLRAFLSEQPELVSRHALLDANEDGEVSSIAVEETQIDGGGLLIRAEVNEVWRDVARLVIEGEDLHLYLLVALRAFLYEHRRKYVWSRGKVLKGVLEALSFPCLDLASPERNLRRVARLMQEVREQLPGDLTHHNIGLDREGAPLHLSAIEAELEATDQEIDYRVYNLYGLTEEEVTVVEGGGIFGSANAR